jgi:hypothetical protein
MDLIHSKVGGGMGHRSNLLNLDVILRWLYNHVLNQHLEHRFSDFVRPTQEEKLFRLSIKVW